MTDQEKLEKIIALIEASELDDTIKVILVRDLKEEGLTEFSREQIRAYCLEGLKKTNSDIEDAKRILENPSGDPEN